MAEFVLTGKQSKAADRIAIFEMGIPSLDLMQKASECVAEYISGAFAADVPVLVAAGVGNNGADGLCISEILAKAGYRCGVIICGNMEKATDEFLYQLERAGSAGVKLSEYEDPGIVARMMEKLCEHSGTTQPVLVDAIFGIGLHRMVEGRYAELINELGRQNFSHICAVDIPSGIDADNGRLMGCGIRADRTITFGCNKIGLLVGEGREYAGTVTVRDIGIPDEAYEMAMEGKDKSLTEE